MLCYVMFRILEYHNHGPAVLGSVYSSIQSLVCPETAADIESKPVPSYIPMPPTDSRWRLNASRPLSFQPHHHRPGRGRGMRDMDKQDLRGSEWTGFFFGCLQWSGDDELILRGWCLEAGGGRTEGGSRRGLVVAAVHVKGEVVEGGRGCGVVRGFCVW